MKPLPGHLECASQNWIGAVGDIPDAWMAHRRHVNANLVRSTGLQFHSDQGRRRESFYGLVVGDTLLATFDDRKLPVVTRMAVDRRIDSAARRIWMPLYESVIDLLDFTFAESIFQRGVGPL
ncbi:hypothetical protein GALL_485600 [mine drainage metagenome]|uniref:Uncharacterized protein n=1 Tax=mine drainage metagenome TaxID=410659 RepID=A0A1J5PF38_9ZZZZ